MSFTDLKIEEYTDRSVAVYGNTRKYKDDLKKLGGKYNSNLKNGPGWIFPKSSQGEIMKFIKNGEHLTPEQITEKHTHISSTSPTISEYGALLVAINKLSLRMDSMEKAIILLLDDDQKKQLEFLNKKISSNSVNIESNISINDSEEYDEDDKPQKRLMRK